MSRLPCSSSRALRLGRIDDGARELVIVEIGKLGMVKDVNADVRYGKGLLCEDKRDKVVTFGDGEKGPGKILMAMLFSEDDGAATVMVLLVGKGSSWLRIWNWN
ncbi:uncharacterized protein LOC133733366 [Rosa rugosa]|uniref:uncharacterized protein LOC133733366 n=1 Tax=Rosa rugosa TaxID=74645 RepID=UPI002B40226A|nr:uncharacterized protein LOC133733366 [Rosa rugosa]